MMKNSKCSILCMLPVSFLLFGTQSIFADSSYDPLAVSARFTPETVDLTVHDIVLHRPTDQGGNSVQP